MSSPLHYDYSRIMKDPHEIPEVAHNVYSVPPIGLCVDPLDMPDAHEEQSEFADRLGSVFVRLNSGHMLGGEILIPPDPAKESFVYFAGLEVSKQIAKGKISIWPCYSQAGWKTASHVTYLRLGTFRQLHEAASLLPGEFGLAILDGWRPLELQREIYESAYSDPDLPAGFVNEPSLDPATAPPHLTGGTVDLTLSYGGVPLALGTLFDDFTDSAYADAFEESSDALVRDLRRLLIHTMRSAQFVVLQNEWWHFEYGTRRWAAITGNEPFYAAAERPAIRVVNVRSEGLGFQRPLHG